ncbi:hypothetical protein SLS62_003539 [Diatrype stigma]|uniref:Cytochrome P450 n=1 Tax=Diatrype stigma TaxID=117547 RepID=A0AAN9YU88_9PEZI
MNVTREDSPDIAAALWPASPSSAFYFTVIAIVLYITYRSALPKPLPGIPHNEDSARRILGDVPYFLEILREGGRPRDFWADLGRKKNSAVTQYFPGPFFGPVVILSDFREAQDLLTRRSKEIDRGSLGTMMFAGVGEHHFVSMNSTHPNYYTSRGLQKDLMAPGYLNALSGPIVYGNVMSLIDLWKFKAKVANGRPFKAIKDLESLTADSIFESAMGITGDDRNVERTLQQLKTEDLSRFTSNDTDSVFPFPEYVPQGLLQTIVVIAEVTGRFPTAPVLRLHWPLNNLRPHVRKAHRERREIIQGYIDRAVEKRQREGPPAQAKTALDILITRELANAEKAGRAPAFQSPIFNDALYGYCFGGQDTTHSSMSFLVKHFGMYPEAQRTLREHLHTAHAAALAERRSPTTEEILRASPIPYLDAFIEEVLRLNTTAAGVIKEATQDLTLLGHHIPKGTQLIVPLWGASIDSPAYPIPESLRSKSCREHAGDVPADWTGSLYPAAEFHPERWLREDEDSGRVVYDPKSGPHMTFSAGPRECWGKRLAYLALRQVTTLLVWNFEFLPLLEGMDSTVVEDVLNAKPKVCLVKVKPLWD